MCEASGTGRRVAALLLAAALANASRAVAAAVIEGTVTLPENVVAPAPKPRYPVAATYVIGPPDPPAAIVYVEGTFPRARPAAPADVGQRGYQFSPGLLAIRTGTTVRFPNLDDEYHSVFSYSRPKRFDLGRYHKDETPAELVFDQPGVVKLFCEIHDHMRGTILVLDTPHFVKTDFRGRYRLEGLPAGTVTVKAWIDDDTLLERTVVLPDGAVVRVDFAPE
ncbi:MAG: hypothetical protein QOD06_2596 [Candidatus Binatota bacterium]|jgi:plastocyanin|nr:hypothetical protein [Candidatus Binatota bacterium]